MKAKFDEGDEIVIDMNPNLKKKKEQIAVMKILDNGIEFTTIKMLHKGHYKMKNRLLDFDDFIVFNDAIRFVNRKRK
jgi:hypothetical protein